MRRAARDRKSIDLTCSTMMNPVSRLSVGTGTWKGKSRWVFVTGQTMARPVPRLNRSLLTDKNRASPPLLVA